MEFFSEIYGCYYKIVSEILKRAEKEGVSKQEIFSITESIGFAESAVTVPDKLISGEWHLLEKNEAGKYKSVLKNTVSQPLALIQKRWLKTVINDSRIGLFMDEESITELNNVLSDVEPLWNGSDFNYYDRFGNGDDFASEEYRKSFRLGMEAIRSNLIMDFKYNSAKGRKSVKSCLPLKIEYSSKNDRFRLIALRLPVKSDADSKPIVDYYRFDGIKGASVREADEAAAAKKSSLGPIDSLIRKNSCEEPVRLLISNRRNALERAMLHFANYDKDTRQIDENTWECLIYYDKMMETELLIEILSFGPVLRVAGPDSFIGLIRERLKKQAEIFGTFGAH